MNEDDRTDPGLVPADCTLSARANRFERDHARRLRALAYRMLGSNAEAEDIVQEAWLRWAEIDEATIERPTAYLSRIVTNLCLDRLGSAAAQREQYVGVWLPEPLLTDERLADAVSSPERQAEFAEDVSVAFMLALERLSPLERAAFLLHEVFDVDYTEIAHHLDREPPACRQLVSRARRSIRTDYARRVVSEEESRFLAEAFANALRSHDVEALARVLTDDAVLMADGGEKVSAAARPLNGGPLVAQVLVHFAQLWKLEKITSAQDLRRVSELR